MADILPCVEVELSKGVTASIIWLHGLGADGHDFEPIVTELNLPHEFTARFVFPHAPQRPVTINNGYIMRAWFDVISFERTSTIDSEGIEQSIKQVSALIEAEHLRGIPYDRIILAGFSQGGVIAIHTALSYRNPLAGVVALSTYLPNADQLQKSLSDENRNIPFFMAHGSFDPVLPIQLGKDSYQQILAMNYQIEWHEYAMEHNVCHDEIQDISHWLQKLDLFS